MGGGQQVRGHIYMRSVNELARLYQHAERVRVHVWGSLGFAYWVERAREQESAESTYSCAHCSLSFNHNFANFSWRSY